jgi:opacity protein-like surface antigen
MRQILNQPGKMLWRLSLCLALLAGAAFCTRSLRAQAVYSGYQANHAIWAGGECSVFSSSFPYQGGSGSNPIEPVIASPRPAASFPGQGVQGIYGCGAFANLRWTYHWDIEGSARWLSFNGYQGTTERTLLIGPRYIIHRFGKFEPYGKFLVGNGSIHYPYSIGTGSYFALAPGGGVNFRLSRRLTVRAEYEYQIWLNSPGFTNEPNHQLHPNGINVGVAYRVWPFKSE